METLKSKDKTAPNTLYSILDIQLQQIEPRALMERIYHFYQPIAGRQGVKISMDVPQESVNILIDERRMLQVLKNLVDNALSYTAAKGENKLSVEAGEQVKLKGSDNGAGIDAKDLPYVFDRFFQGNKARG